MRNRAEAASNCPLTQPRRNSNKSNSRKFLLNEARTAKQGQRCKYRVESTIKYIAKKESLNHSLHVRDAMCV